MLLGWSFLESNVLGRGYWHVVRTIRSSLCGEASVETRRAWSPIRPLLFRTCCPVTFVRYPMIPITVVLSSGFRSKDGGWIQNAMIRSMSCMSIFRRMLAIELSAMVISWRQAWPTICLRLRILLRHDLFVHALIQVSTVMPVALTSWYCISIKRSRLRSRYASQIMLYVPTTPVDVGPANRTSMVKRVRVRNAESRASRPRVVLRPRPPICWLGEISRAFSPGTRPRSPSLNWVIYSAPRSFLMVTAVIITQRHLLPMVVLTGPSWFGFVVLQPTYHMRVDNGISLPVGSRTRRPICKALMELTLAAMVQKRLLRIVHDLFEKGSCKNRRKKMPCTTTAFRNGNVILEETTTISNGL